MSSARDNHEGLCGRPSESDALASFDTLMVSIHNLAPELITYILSDQFDIAPEVSEIPHPCRPKPLPRIAQNVCRRWRSIVQTSGNLNLVTCVFDERPRTYDKSLPAIETYTTWLKANTRCDVDVRMTGWYHDSCFSRIQYRLEAALPFIRPYSHRWRLFSASELGASEFKNVLRSLVNIGGLSRLTKLDIMAPVATSAPNDDILLDLRKFSCNFVAPRLLHLTLCGMHFTWPCTSILINLVSLKIETRSSSSCPTSSLVSQLLRNALNLEHFILNLSSCPPTASTGEEEAHAYEIEHLRTLSLTVTPQYALSLLRCLQLPQLRGLRLKWLGTHNDDDYEDQVSEIHLLQLRRIRLSLRSANDTMHFLSNIHAPNLLVLRVNNRSPLQGRPHAQRFDILQYPSLQDFKSQGDPLSSIFVLHYIQAPSLKRVTIFSIYQEVDPPEGTEPTWHITNIPVNHNIENLTLAAQIKRSGEGEPQLQESDDSGIEVDENGQRTRLFFGAAAIHEPDFATGGVFQLFEHLAKPSLRVLSLGNATAWSRICRSHEDKIGALEGLSISLAYPHESRDFFAHVKLLSRLRVLHLDINLDKTEEFDTLDLELLYSSTPGPEDAPLPNLSIFQIMFPKGPPEIRLLQMLRNVVVVWNERDRNQRIRLKRLEIYPPPLEDFQEWFAGHVDTFITYSSPSMFSSVESLLPFATPIVEEQEVQER